MMKKMLCLLFVFGFIPAFAQDAAVAVQEKVAEAPSAVEQPATEKQQIATPAAKKAEVKSAENATPAQPQAPETAPKPQQTTKQTPAKQPSQEVAQTPDAAKSSPQAAAESTSAQPKPTEEKPAATDNEKKPEEFVTARETVKEEEEEPEGWLAKKVEYAPKTQRDPTLSPDDFLLLQYREQQRLAAIEAERQRKLAEERRKKEEAERQRQLELARIKDPTREVRNKIKIGGIIGQEVFIGSKIYTVGNTIYGARIVSVSPEEVVFSYKGHKFVRKVPL